MQRPKHFLVFKILSAIALAVTIVGIVLMVTGFGNFDNKYFMIGSMMLCLGLFCTFLFGVIGFNPEITKMWMKSAKYIQQENKEDMADMATAQAEMYKDALAMTAQVVKEGVADMKYCKHCGAKIDADSRFCKECGGAQ